MICWLASTVPKRRKNQLLYIWISSEKNMNIMPPLQKHAIIGKITPNCLHTPEAELSCNQMKHTVNFTEYVCVCDFNALQMCALSHSVMGTFLSPRRPVFFFRQLKCIQTPSCYTCCTLHPVCLCVITQDNICQTTAVSHPHLKDTCFLLQKSTNAHAPT